MMISTPHPSTPSSRPTKIAYTMSRFPKLSETFVLYEILELERQGIRVEVFPLIREKEQVVHAEAQPIVARAHYSKPNDAKVLASHRYWLSKKPGVYTRLWFDVVRGNIRSPKFLSRAMIVMLQGAWFAQQMEALGVEHVHAHFATHPALVAYVVHQLTHIPYSFTVHADDIYTEQVMLETKIQEAAFVVAISDYNRRFLSQLYGSNIEHKILVNHCGVDVSVFEPRAQLAARDIFVMTCVARLEEKKGHRYLVEACKLLQDRGIPFRCQFIGEGELREEVEAQIERLGLREHVLLLGRQPRNRVKELLAESDVMVLPSITTPEGRQEGIPVALMEAMATELPVISTRISGIPELIDHGSNGLLVPEQNAEALANAIILLQSNPQVGRQLGAAGRVKVLQEFHLQHNTETLAQLFQRELQTRPSTNTTMERTR
jgi:colanic acid/amylovoran biosynthesis glycosyltransferase